MTGAAAEKRRKKWPWDTILLFSSKPALNVFFPAILQGGQWGFSLTAFSQFFFDPFPNIREILKVVDKC